jgi:O-succinylbenzoic acid--CoA ligase
MERAELACLLGETPRLTSATEALLIEADSPRHFMRRLAEAIAGRGPIFLGDATWSQHQRDAAREVALTQSAAGAAVEDIGWLMIPTGGTSGGLRFVRHDGHTLSAAVRGWCDYFKLERVNAVSVLPLHHVSGLMAWMRVAMTGGEFVVWNWSDLKAGQFPPIDRSKGWVISLVPTQLQRLLAIPSAIAWLRGFHVIFVGGGPMWASLANVAEQEGLRLSLSYGMSETAAMIAATQPEEFLAGDRSAGRALPHARIGIEADGGIRVASQSLFRGYWPDLRAPAEFVTEDIGRIDEQGRLHIIGRRDATIITGGKKVNPAEVEAALRESGEFTDVAVIGVPDGEWGEAVVVCFPDGRGGPDVTRAVANLAPHQRPKRFVALREWPRNAQGKVNRALLRASVLAAIDGTKKIGARP